MALEVFVQSEHSDRFGEACGEAWRCMVSVATAGDSPGWETDWADTERVGGVCAGGVRAGGVCAIEVRAGGVRFGKSQFRSPNVPMSCVGEGPAASSCCPQVCSGSAAVLPEVWATRNPRGWVMGYRRKWPLPTSGVPRGDEISADDSAFLLGGVSERRDSTLKGLGFGTRAPPPPPPRPPEAGLSVRPCW